MRRRTFLASGSALLASPRVAGEATAAGFGPLGWIELRGTKDAVVAGGTAYVATTDGFATVDVSEPTAPAVLADRRGLLSDRSGGPLGGIWDLDVDGDRLVVAGPASGSTAALEGMVVYDVADPADPRRIDFFETSYPIHNLSAVDSRAYLTGNDRSRNPLVIVDVSGESATELGRWSLLDADEAWSDVNPVLRVLHDVWVQAGRAYLAHWDAGTWIVDVSDPTAPSVVSQVRGRSPAELADISGRTEMVREYIQTPGNDHYVTVSEDATLLAVGAEAWDVTSDDRVGGPGDVELYDISTPTEPRKTATIEAPATDDPSRQGVWTTSHNFDLVDGRLYTSWYRGGVRIHDVSDPASPTELAAWADRERTQFFTAKRAAGRPFFVASSLSDPGPSSLRSGLYTFPTVDADGVPAITPPATTTESGTTSPTTTTTDGKTTTRETTADPTTTTTTETTTTTTTETTTTATEAGPTTAPAPETTTRDTTTADGRTTTSGSGPGFGPLATLLAAGWYALARRSGE